MPPFGYKHSDEAKRKMSEHNLAHPRKYWLGKKRSEETSQKIREKHLISGHRPPSQSGKVLSQERKEQIRRIAIEKGYGKWMTGKKATEETRRKLRELVLGEKAPAWKGGITPIHHSIRGSLEYRIWRENVFKRDKFGCSFCGDDSGGNLNAHHILPFSIFPERRFEINNGITLCEDCHNKVSPIVKIVAEARSYHLERVGQKYNPISRT